eukprot:3358469-Rhodomonas_salina.1
MKKIGEWYPCHSERLENPHVIVPHPPCTRPRCHVLGYNPRETVRIKLEKAGKKEEEKGPGEKNTETRASRSGEEASEDKQAAVGGGGHVVGHVVGGHGGGEGHAHARGGREGGGGGRQTPPAPRQRDFRGPPKHLRQNAENQGGFRDGEGYQERDSRSRRYSSSTVRPFGSSIPRCQYRATRSK